MYLEHFGIKEFPFTLTPNLNYFCNLSTHQEALNTLLLSLRSGEGFIKIIGEVGSGKTLLCRKLLNCLEEGFITAYIPNPDLTPAGLRRALAQELGLDLPNQIDSHTLLNKITDKLLALHGAGKRVVVIIDEAQALSDESLEALRLLTNIETETNKLLQIVLFAQPELDIRLMQNKLRQLRQRITFSYFLKTIREEELDAYLCHRLAMAGYTRGSMFSKSAEKLLYRCSHGTPRLINILAHKALIVSFGKGQHKVSKHAVIKALSDTEGLANHEAFYKKLMMTLLISGVMFYGLMWPIHHAAWLANLLPWK